MAALPLCRNATGAPFPGKLIPFGWLLAVLGDSGRALHDYIAKTQVVGE